VGEGADHEEEEETVGTSMPQPWWLGPLQVADGLATVVIAVATIVYAGYAAKQWRAIRDQSKIAQDALIADKRAIIYATNINPVWEVDKTTGLYNWRFKAGLRNGGATATRRLRMYVDCEVRNTILPPGYAFNPHDSSANDPSMKALLSSPFIARLRSLIC
jgi:hypothetical protein